MIWGEHGRPGYGLFDRALGAMYLQGLWEGDRRELGWPNRLLADPGESYHDKMNSRGKAMRLLIVPLALMVSLDWRVFELPIDADSLAPIGT